MPGDYSGYDWYLRLLAWATRIGLAAPAVALVALVVITIRALL